MRKKNNMEQIQGVIFPVDRKRDSNCPDYTGTIRFEDGREIKVVGWDRQSKDDKYFIKIKTDKNFSTFTPELKN